MYIMAPNACLSIILSSCGWVSIDVCLIYSSNERLKIRMLKYFQRSEMLIASSD